jgi:hypothetical protein
MQDFFRKTAMKTGAAAPCPLRTAFAVNFVVT